MGSVAKGLGGGGALGKVGKFVGFMNDPLGLFKQGGESGPQLNKDPFDVKAIAKKYEDIYTKQRQDAEARSAAANTPALIADLSARAMGKGPSLAEAQLKSATNRNLAQQLAAASAMRGRNPAASQRQIMQQQGQAGRSLAQDSAIARLQEQSQAAQQLAGQQQMADVLNQNATGEGFRAALSPKQNLQQYETKRFDYDVLKTEGEKQRDAQMQAALLGSVGTAGAAMAGSDERGKKNVKNGAKDVDSFLNALAAKNYEYKDASKPGTAPGKRVGIMAQDLEQSDMGKTLVKNTPQGKMVDTVQGFGAVLAAQAELHKRIKALEGKKKV